MNVNLNPNILSYFLQNNSWSNSSLTNSTESSSSASSWFNGTDTVQISQAAINALLSAEENTTSSEDNSSPVYDMAQIIQDKLDALVSDGTITEEQEDAIQSSLESAIQQAAPPPPPSEGDIEEQLSSKLDELVAAGTITEEQKDVVLDALKPPARDGKDAPPPPPPSEDGGFEEMLTSKLDELVKAGTITEDQKSSIFEALKPAS